MSCRSVVVVVSMLCALSSRAQVPPSPPELVDVPAAEVQVEPMPAPTTPQETTTASANAIRDARFAAALPAVLVGFGLGATALSVIVASTTIAAGMSVSGFIPGVVVGGIAMIALPTAAVALFTQGLSPWTIGLVPLGVAVGGAAGFTAGFATGYFLSFAVDSTPDDDCMCDPDSTTALFVTPIVGAVVLGGAGAVVATAIGANMSAVE